jgi:cytochrome c5
MGWGVPLLLAGVMLFVASCGGKEEAGTTQGVSGGEAAASVGSMSGPEGAALVQKRCTICHTIERVEAATLDRSGWERTVDVMIDKGATLTDAERNAVIDYLSRK